MTVKNEKKYQLLQSGTLFPTAQPLNPLSSSKFSVSKMKVLLNGSVNFRVKTKPVWSGGAVNYGTPPDNTKWALQKHKIS
jgi:hypothetical protein